MGKAIGIDLGTTNSCCAFVVNGKPQVVTYRDGSRTIPSVFAIDKSGNRLVGNEAREQAARNPDHTIAASKRLIGRNYGSSAIQRMQQVFTYELVEGESNEVLIRVADQVFTLEQISAAILRRIKDSAEEALDGEVDQAVITVPAYFNDRQRQAVRSAGKLAGLRVLRVLNEPTAAALAYGLGRTLNQRVAIYDLGGGTFDISIIDIKDKIFEVIATGGDTFLGGVDFDDRLMQWVLQSFADETDIDVSYDRSAVTRIREGSELAKIRLSDVETTEIVLNHICDDDDGKPINLRMTVTRELLEGLTEDLIDRSIATVDRILQEAATNPDDIDEMLLVGGQSRMPLVRRKLQSFIGQPPSTKVHPDEAVAIGAAIMAHSLSSKAGPQDMTLLDVLPMAIGINKVDGTMHVLFAKNQPLPDYKTLVLTTSKDGQRSIMLRIYQGESRFVRENELLGTFVFSGLRAARRGEVKIEVTFHIDSEGILNLTARDIDTGQLVESRLKLGRDPGASRGGRRRRKGGGSGPRPPSSSPPAPQPPSLNMPRKSSLAAPTPPGAAAATMSAPATLGAQDLHSPSFPPPVMRHTTGDDVDLLDPDEPPLPSGGRSHMHDGMGGYGSAEPAYSNQFQDDQLPERREPRGFFEWLLSLFGLLD